MRAVHLVGIVLLCAAPTAGGQKTEPPKPAKPTTLSGCVTRGESGPDQFTLSETKESKVYRLTGPDLREYVGRRVQVVGGVHTRLRIVGGLMPTPNVAAQAGSEAMDPSQAIVAGAIATTGPGKVELQEFRVKSVRPISGTCSN